MLGSKKLNLGCGKDILKGYVNLDSVRLNGVDIVHNLDKYPWPFKSNSFEEIKALGVLEHLNDKILPMEEIWRISKNNAKIFIQVPIFPGIYTVCDPTHRVFFNYSSFDYFIPENKGLDYYTKVRFSIICRKIVFHPALRFMEAVNISKFTQKFYAAFLCCLIPAVNLEAELRVVK